MSAKGKPTAALSGADVPRRRPVAGGRPRPGRPPAAYAAASGEPALAPSFAVSAASARFAASAADDHFAERDGEVFAGTHVLLDLWGASHLDDADYLERALRRAIDVSGATLLHIHLHRFGDGGGVSGVAVLAESHISVHTWPERGFAAFDVFMCGGCRPDLAAEVLRSALEPARTEMSVERRGVVA